MHTKRLKKLYGLPPTAQTTIYRAGDDGHFETGLPDGTTAALVQLFGDPDEATRFVDNGDGTVTDHATGLMWVKDPQNGPGSPFDATMDWDDAIDNCLALSYAGHTDWRLPNINELCSIIDFENASMKVWSPLVLADGSYYYWSATTDATWSPYAWYVWWDFLDVHIYFWGAKSSLYWAWPVRGGVYNNNTP
jgi:hypothetical protein